VQFEQSSEQGVYPLSRFVWISLTGIGSSGTLMVATLTDTINSLAVNHQSFSVYVGTGGNPSQPSNSIAKQDWAHDEGGAILLA